MVEGGEDLLHAVPFDRLADDLADGDAEALQHRYQAERELAQGKLEGEEWSNAASQV